MAVSTNYSNRDLFLDTQAREVDDTKAKDDVLGKDAFLTMMVAQLKNQDPLSPMEGSDFTAQLAQFSGLEQQITTNTNLDSILKALETSTDESNLFDYIGKNITSDGNPVNVQDGEIISGGSFTLDDAATIDVVVYNSEGNPVRVLSSGSEPISAGSYNIEWDGRDENGFKVLDGEYKYEVVAKTSAGEYASVNTTSSGLVSGITSVGGRPYLVVGDRNVDPASVDTISIAEEPED